MLDQILKGISPKNQGFIALILGALVLVGSVGRLGILQDFFYIIMIISGIHLIVWGVKASGVLGDTKGK